MLNIRKRMLSRLLHRYNIDIQYIINMGRPKKGFLGFTLRVFVIELLFPKNNGNIMEFDEYEKRKTGKKNKKNVEEITY